MGVRGKAQPGAGPPLLPLPTPAAVPAEAEGRCRGAAALPASPLRALRALPAPSFPFFLYLLSIKINKTGEEEGGPSEVLFQSDAFRQRILQASLLQMLICWGPAYGTGKACQHHTISRADSVLSNK